jgi:hypothetical protein
VATVVQQFAARLALVGFAAASAQGLFEGQAFEPALKRALGVAAALFALGWICGWLAQQAIRESVESDATRKGPVAP